MKCFLLLILSLMTGCLASSDDGDDDDDKDEDHDDDDVLMACAEGWVEFNCTYPNQNKVYTNVQVVKGNKPLIQSNQNHMWKEKGRFSVYPDRNKKILRVAIKQLQPEDSGKYECKFKFRGELDSSEDEVKLKVEENCQEPLNQTVFGTGTISCDPGNKYESKVKFFCKERGSICEDVLSTNSSLEPNGIFTPTKTKNDFNVSITHVTSEHAGVYWCGVEEEEKKYRASFRRIQLEVKDPQTTPSTVTVFPTPSTSSDISTASTASPPVTSTPSTVTVTSSWSSAQSTAASKQQSNKRFSWLTVIIAVVVCGIVLVLLLISVLCYKRFQHSRNTGEQNEAHPYEEIQDCPQKPGLGTALRTIYATASAPTNPSTASQYDSSAEVSLDTVKDISPCPTYSTVNHPSTLPEEPFYSTVNKPQQH